MLPKLIYSFLEIYWKVVKPKTLGARALIINDGRVLLVKHTYLSDWYLPGGGIKRSENFKSGLIRELKEELGIKVNNFELLGTYFNSKEGKRDSLKVFLTRYQVDTNKIKPDNKETREIKFFNLNNLPKDTSPEHFEEFKNINLKNILS